MEYMTKKELVARALLECFAKGELKPGEHLVASEVATRFGTSITPVREALSQLESEGVVTTIPNKGTFVAAHSKEEFAEICTIRALLEGLAIDLASPRMTEQDYAWLRNVTRQAERAARVGKHLEAQSLRHSFHVRILQRSGSAKLLEVSEYLYRQVRWRSVPKQHETDFTFSIVQHDAIVDALQAGDTESAKQILREHLQAFVDLVGDGHLPE